MIVLPKVGGFWIDPPSVADHNDGGSDAVSSSAASTASSTNEQHQDFKVFVAPANSMIFHTLGKLGGVSI